MNQEQFDTLVKQLENFARQRPTIYRLRVGLLAVLGYAYIFLVLAGLLVAIGLIVLLVIYSQRINAAIIKLAVVLLIPAFIALNSLWVTFPQPTGLELNRKQVPRLFALMDELTAKLQAPRFHNILLTEDFNAAVVQRPRLGIFGWQKNYLILGLPLMQALSPEQFRAVLAHEFGHLSGNHSRFAGWVYRVRKTWIQLMQRLQESGHDGSDILFNRFFNWYAPFFSAYSFVLGRMNEYEADRCAAELAGAKNTAEALINVEVQARFLQHSFWPTVYQQVKQEIEPPSTTFTTLSQALRTEVKPEEATQWLDQALVEKTSNADTHPCLSDRLSALGYLSTEGQVLMPTPVQISAADAFLGDALNQLTSYFDSSWREQVATPWRQRYAYAQEVQQQLQELEKKAQNQPLTDEEALDRACWTAEFKGNEAAIPLFQEILSRQPAHAAANYTLGQILLQQNDAQGIDYIEKAMAVAPEMIISGGEIIYFFLKQQGKLEQAKVYQKKIEQHYNLIEKAQQERSFVRASDQFRPHNLSDETLQQLCQQLARYDRLKAAYLVQKVVECFPEKPFYIIGIKRHRGFLEIDSDKLDYELINQLANEVEFSGDIYFIILNQNTQKLGNKIRRVERAELVFES